MIRFACPSCKKALSVNEAQAGALVQCPDCKTRMKAPAAPAPTPAAPAPTAGGSHIAAAAPARTPAPPAPVPPATTTTPAAVAPGPAASTRIGWKDIKGVFDKLKGLVNSLQEVHGAAIKVIALAPIVGGLVGDFLRPLAPFNFLIFLLSLLGALSLVFLFVKKPHTFNVKLGSLCAFLLVAAIGFGGWWALAFAFSSQDKGLLATAIPPLGKLQDAVITSRSDAGVITEKKVEGDKIAEQILKQIESEKDAGKLLHFAFEGYPAKVIKASVPTNPQGIKGAAGQVKFEVKLEADLDQYNDLLAKKLLPVLNKVASAKGEALVTATSHKDDSYERGIFTRGFDRDFQASLQDGKWTCPDLLRVGGKGSGGDDKEFGSWWQGSLDPKAEMVIAVNSSRNAPLDRTTWKWFHVPHTEVFDLKRRRCEIAINIHFVDGKGEDVSREKLTMEGDCVPCLRLGYHGGKYNPASEILVSPLILTTHRYYVGSLSFQHTMRMTVDELQKVKSIRCTVENVR